ncbi:MAG TPA: YchJ family metal-binding protein [Nocardioides sp.]
MQLERPCPCGLPAPYDACCGRLHRGAALAVTAEELMRSRYAAHAVGGRTGADHLFRTWHPRTRPDDTDPADGLAWTGLEVHATADGGPDDATGVVEFTARWTAADGSVGALHERSRFARRAGRWVYIDGDVDEAG